MKSLTKQLLSKDERYYRLSKEPSPLLFRISATLLREITRTEGVNVIPLDSEVLEMSVDLHFQEIEPSEFDRAILAVVLTTGHKLRENGETDVAFAELDSKLWPWEKNTGNARRALKRLYDEAGVWVYSDFTLTSPERPPDFPEIIPID